MSLPYQLREMQKNLQQMEQEGAHAFDFTVDETIDSANEAAKAGREKIVQLRSLVDAMVAGTGCAEDLQAALEGLHAAVTDAVANLEAAAQEYPKDTALFE